MKDRLQLVMLLDFYSNLLKDHGRQVMIDFAEHDLSISEIAQKNGVTRQAVLDTIKKQGQKLEEFEDKLQLVSRFSRARELLLELKQSADGATKKKIEQILDIL